MRSCLFVHSIEYNWEHWRFSKVPAGFWKDKANQRAFFDSISKQLNITRWEDWYRIKKGDIEALGGGPLLGQCYEGSLSTALIAIYPGCNNI